MRPKKIVLDFQKGKAVGPVPDEVKSGVMQEGNNDFVGELSVTLVDARKLSYLFYGTLFYLLSFLVVVMLININVALPLCFQKVGITIYSH